MKLHLSSLIGLAAALSAVQQVSAGPGKSPGGNPGKSPGKSPPPPTDAPTKTPTSPPPTVAPVTPAPTKAPTTDAPTTSAPTSASQGQVAEGGTCYSYFNANSGGGQGAWKKYKGSADYYELCQPLAADGTTPLACIPDDTAVIADANGWQKVQGTCKLATCEGLDETEGIDVDNIPFGEDPGTRRVTICHRTCSTNNPWVRITVDYHAFEADNGICGGEDGNDHTRHDVKQDCSGYTGDYSEWGGLYTEDYLIRYHGSRAEVATNWTSNGDTYEGFSSEKDYWAYWERACPSVRANKGANSCCFDGDCCGYVPPTSPPTSTPPPTPTPPPTTPPPTTAPPTQAVVPAPTTTPASTSNAGSQGDPHFKTWQDEHFEYHGQCDLVLAKDPQFADGLGIDVQIRTKLVRFWSYIKSAAVRIGNDVFEVQGNADSEVGDAIYWYNMEHMAPVETIGGFPLTIYPANKGTKQIVEIDLSSKYPDTKIEFQIWKEFVKVNFVNPTPDAFCKCVGMLGDYESGKTLARDRATEISDYYKLGNEWQVLPTDLMLFHNTEQPQFPSKCIEPEDPRGERRRRLDESSVTMEDAEQACSTLTDEIDRKDCIYDIIATQDMGMAGAY